MTIKVHQLSLTIPRPGITITCIPGFPTHSGLLDSGFQDFSVSATSTEPICPMGNERQSATISWTTRREGSFRLIRRREGPGDLIIPQRMRPKEGALPLPKPEEVLRQSSSRVMKEQGSGVPFRQELEVDLQGRSLQTGAETYRPPEAKLPQ